MVHNRQGAGLGKTGDRHPLMLLCHVRVWQVLLCQLLSHELESGIESRLQAIGPVGPDNEHVFLGAFHGQCGSSSRQFVGQCQGSSVQRGGNRFHGQTYIPKIGVFKRGSDLG